jgi:quinol-cytochrome oxidoreductase complex cytochrome b subunit
VAALSNLSFAQFAIAVVGAALLAMFIFRHADRHGSRHATAWGLFTFLFALAAIPLYFFNYWLANRREP